MTHRSQLAATAEKLAAALDAELLDIFAGREELGPMFATMVECWYGAAKAQLLTRLEFDPQEADQLLDERIRAALREVKYTGASPIRGL